MANAYWFYIYIKGTLLFRWGAIAGNDLYKGIGLRLRRTSSLHLAYEAVKAELGRELDGVQRRGRAVPAARSSARVALQSVS
ncbi:MAG: hypothetical protein ABI607_10295 [Betaproteobacteria bacterium]